MGKVVKYSLAVLLGVILTTVYFTPHKAETLNMFAFRLYMKTEIGQESMRMQLLSDCYFAAQALQLGKGIKIDMIEMKYETCKKLTDESLEWLKKGMFPAQL